MNSWYNATTTRASPGAYLVLISQDTKKLPLDYKLLEVLNYKLIAPIHNDQKNACH